MSCLTLLVCRIFCCGQNVFVQGIGIPWKLNSSFTTEKLFKASEKEARSSTIPSHVFFSGVLWLVFRKFILGVQPLEFPSTSKFAHAEFYQNDIRCLRSHE